MLTPSTCGGAVSTSTPLESVGDVIGAVALPARSFNTIENGVVPVEEALVTSTVADHIFPARCVAVIVWPRSVTVGAWTVSFVVK